MSVFKRLGNVARGKMMEIGRNLSGDGLPDGEPDELDPDDPPPRRALAPETARVTPPMDEQTKRTTLAKLRDEGLLTEEEYAEKLSALDAPPAPPAPRKRRL